MIMLWYCVTRDSAGRVLAGRLERAGCCQGVVPLLPDAPPDSPRQHLGVQLPVHAGPEGGQPGLQRPRGREHCRVRRGTQYRSGFLPSFLRVIVTVSLVSCRQCVHRGAVGDSGPTHAGCQRPEREQAAVQSHGDEGLRQRQTGERQREDVMYIHTYKISSSHLFLDSTRV